MPASVPRLPQPGTGPSTPPGGTSAPRRGRTPDAVRTVLKGESAPFRLCRGPGAGVVTRRLLDQSTLGDVVTVLVGQLVPLRATPDGRLSGWYRLGPVAGPLPASTRLSAINAEDTLYFHPVSGHTQPFGLDVAVEGRALSLTVPVHTAVPAATLVDALCTMLGLPAGDWNLQVDGAPVEPSGILEDHSITPESRLKLVKA